ncbi:S9 family peptidase [Peribacillus kribbensis]|uniref:S9 family peptidase n=1 Tax=Peribacillus kribbensis TaxID=356658 RepID=UPI00040D94EA|nr:S9 family peptidase [Peribacillus kribbensis]
MKGISADDLYQLYSVTDPQLSPDGNKTAYVQTIAEKELRTYISNIYILNMESKETKQWTFGRDRTFSPRWSPDGKGLAFLSKRDGKAQLYLLKTAGGEARCLTEVPHGIEKLIWSPCSGKILFSALVDSAENGSSEESRLKSGIYKSLRFKSDARGYLQEQYLQLFIHDLKKNETKQLTHGDYDCTPEDWSADGSWIAYTASADKDRDFQIVSDIHILNLESKETQIITDGKGLFTTASWSPDQKYLLITGHRKDFMGATLSKIWLYDMELAQLSCLTEEWDVYAGDAAIGDFHVGGSNASPQWTSDSQGFYFIMTDYGSTGLYYGNIEGAMYTSRQEQEHIYGFSIHPSSHTAVAAVSCPENPGDLYDLNLMNGEFNRLTSVNEEVLSTRKIAETEPISWTAPDGLTLHGWMMKPADFDPGQSYPLLLEIHGGPHAMYANTYYHEFQALAAQGFVILYTNPRGSHGYGQTFVDAVRGDYGGKDYLDLLSGVDYLLNTYPYLDQSRLGVTGGSYGGFMTNWIITHTDRFKAAVTQRCISNWISFYGVSDIGYYFTEWELLGDAIHDPEILWNHSPLKYVSNVNTPLLLLHGEKDYRCPVQQAEEFYTALRRQKKEAVLISYENENHEVTRSGSPASRIDHIKQIRDWFLKYVM